VEAALSIGLGGNLKFLSAEGKGSFSSTAARLQAIHDAESIATQLGYSETTEKVVSSAQSLSEGTRNSKGTESGKSALSSLNHAKNLREEASIAQNKVKTLSKDISSNQSKGLTISKELTQEVLEFIAHQPANPGPNGASGGQIGYKEARRILEGGGEERVAYLKRFQEAHPQYSIQSINVRGAESILNAQYETQTQHHKSNTGIQDQNASNIQSVPQYAKNSGFDRADAGQISLHKAAYNKVGLETENLPQETVKGFVKKQLKDSDQKIKDGKKPLADHEQILQDKQKAAQDKTLLGTAVKNLATSTGEGLLSAAKDINEVVKKLPPEPPSIFP